MWIFFFHYLFFESYYSFFFNTILLIIFHLYLKWANLGVIFRLHCFNVFFIYYWDRGILWIIYRFNYYIDFFVWGLDWIISRIIFESFLLNFFTLHFLDNFKYFRINNFKLSLTSQINWYFRYFFNFFTSSFIVRAWPLKTQIDTQISILKKLLLIHDNISTKFHRFFIISFYKFANYVWIKVVVFIF